MDQIHLSVIIPAYKEEKKISSTLLAVDKHLAKQNYSYEIIVADDGSPDKTVEIVKKFMGLVKNLRLLENPENHGKGYVVRQGMLAAKGRYRLFTDADNSTPIEHLDKVWPHFEKGYEIVIGSRDKKDAKGAGQAIPQTFFKRMLGNLGNVLVQVLAVWGIWDTQCGFKAMTDKAAEDVFSRCTINRWGFDIEMMAIAKRLGYKIAIIPVFWINRAESRVGAKGMGGYFSTLAELFKIKYNLMSGKYNLKNKRHDR